jgi:hypothetical protein
MQARLFQISNSPFFAVTLTIANLRCRLIVASSFFLGFNLLALLAGQPSLVLRVSARNKTQVMNVPSASQPFQIYPAGPAGSTSLTIHGPDGATESIAPSGSFYRFRSTADHFSLLFHSDQIHPVLDVELRHPRVGAFLLFTRFAFFLVVLFSCVFSYVAPLIRPALPANLFCILYVTYRLQVITTSPLCDAFAIPILWVSYLYVILSQSHTVSATAPWVHATMHAIAVGTAVALFIGLYEPSAAPFMAVIWLFIPGLSAYLFVIGKAAVHPALLAVHFGFFVVVSGSVYFSALSRGFWAPSATLWDETLDLSAVAVFAEFQILCLIGDRIGERGAAASIGSLARRGQIDSLLSSLAAREEEELKAGAGFA